MSAERSSSLTRRIAGFTAVTGVSLLCILAVLWSPALSNDNNNSPPKNGPPPDGLTSAQATANNNVNNIVLPNSANVPTKPPSSNGVPATSRHISPNNGNVRSARNSNPYGGTHSSSNHYYYPNPYRSHRQTSPRSHFYPPGGEILRKFFITPMPPYTYVRDTCLYCFESIQNGLNICTHNYGLCEEHLKLHLQGNEACCAWAFATSPDNKTLTVTPLDPNDQGAADSLAKEAAIFLQNLNEPVKLCPHITADNTTTRCLNNALRCSDCECAQNLWACLHCPHIGCGQDPAIADSHGHAKAHSTATGHSAAAMLSSVNPSGAHCTFCYSCDNFVLNPEEYKLTRTVDASGASISSPPVPDLAEPSSAVCPAPASVDSPFTGIQNIGQTCYLAASLQLLAYTAYLANVNLEDHFINCNLNPIQCMACQFSKIAIRLNAGHRDLQARNQCIAIHDFVDLMSVTMPGLTAGDQQDCSEFLTLLFDNPMAVQPGQAQPQIPFIPALLQKIRFTTANRLLCNCGGAGQHLLQQKSAPLLVVSFAATIEEALNKRKETTAYTCDRCKAQTEIQLEAIIDFPEFLIVYVQRLGWEAGDAVKNSGKIDASLIPEECVGEGAPGYLLKSAMIHVGMEAKFGHYVWWVPYDGKYYCVNDGIVEDSCAEAAQDGVVFMYQRM